MRDESWSSWTAIWAASAFLSEIASAPTGAVRTPAVAATVNTASAVVITRRAENLTRRTPVRTMGISAPPLTNNRSHIGPCHRC